MGTYSPGKISDSGLKPFLEPLVIRKLRQILFTATIFLVYFTTNIYDMGL